MLQLKQRNTKIKSSSSIVRTNRVFIIQCEDLGIARFCRAVLKIKDYSCDRE